MLQTFKHKIKSFSMGKKLTLLLAVVIIAAMGIGSTFAYVITGTPSLVNLFINGLNPDGNLTIEKTLVHPYGKDYKLPEDLAFTFDVELGDKYAGETLKTTQGDKTADESGKLTVSIAPSSRVTIYDIDEETAVTVTETHLGKGFTAKEPSKSVTIEKYKDNFLSFANTYAPAKAPTKDLAVGGRKTLEGRQWKVGDQFTFALELYDAEKEEWVSLAEDDVTYEETEVTKADGSVEIAPVEGFDTFDFNDDIRKFDFDEVGTYRFRVKEMEDQNPAGGVTYDKSESYFDIIVTDTDMDGYLEIQEITSTSSNTKIEKQKVDISFVNRYAPIGSAKIEIDIQKTLNDKSGQNQTPAGYTFELYDAAQTDEDAKPVMTSEGSTSLGKASLTLVYTPDDAGKVFNYELKETNAGKEIDGLTYDAKVYKLQVSVIDNLDGTVSAYVYETPKSSYTGTIPPEGANMSFTEEFTNIYDPKNDTVTLSGKKVLTGRKLAEQEFEFDLYKADKNYRVDKDASPIDSATHDLDGSFAFDPLSYDQVGSYYYVVKENATANARGIEYDDTCYMVKVDVRDEGGQLKAVKSIVDDKGAEADIVFNNKYVPNAVRHVIEGIKVLKDGQLKAEAFTFQMYLADENFDAQGAPCRTAVNDAEGTFAFDALEFTAAGTYYYIIKEDTSAPIEDVTYDTREYHVTIKVTDPGDGQLVIESADIALGEKTVDTIEYVNTFEDDGDGGLGGDDNPPDGDDNKPTDDDDKPGHDGNKPGSNDKPEGNDKPGSDDKKPVGEGPDTGDHNMLGAWLVLLCTTGMLITVILIYRRKYL